MREKRGSFTSTGIQQKARARAGAPAILARLLRVGRGAGPERGQTVARVLTVLAILAWAPTSPARAQCILNLIDVSNVCVSDVSGTTCTTTRYYGWECSGGAPLPPNYLEKIPTGGKPIDPPKELPKDENANGKIEDWLDVVDTVDINAACVVTNDHLGTNYGGANTIRKDHVGVDIQCDPGDGVFSAITGTVTRVGLAGVCGNSIDIKVSSSRTMRYCHFRDLSTRLVGELAKAGERIGNCGMSGNATGPHVHITYGDFSTSPASSLEEFWNHIDGGPENLEADACKPSIHNQEPAP